MIHSFLCSGHRTVTLSIPARFTKNLSDGTTCPRRRKLGLTVP